MNLNKWELLLWPISEFYLIILCNWITCTLNILRKRLFHFQALKHYTSNLGWILLEINSGGEIECVTENIKELIRKERTELYKTSIFDLLHIEDHKKLRPLLRDIQTYGWGAGDADKFQAFQVRLLDNPDGTDDSGSVDDPYHYSLALLSLIPL